MANAILIPQFEPDLSDYALKSHTHDQYLTSHQSLTNYATKTYVQNQIAAIDFPDAGVSTFNGRSGAVVPKDGDYTASMVGAAAKTHSHTGYASSTHNHDSDYAAKSHTHSGYASSTHNHDSKYAAKSHTHSADDITGLDGGGGGSMASYVFTTTSHAAVTLPFKAKFVYLVVLGYDKCHAIYPGDTSGSSYGSLSSDGKTFTPNGPTSSAAQGSWNTKYLMVAFS